MKSQSLLQYDSIRITFTIIFLTLLFAVFPFQLQAKVTGVCSNCHTMHNSQNGVVDPVGTNDNLLNGFNEASSCIGCHSSADAATWKDGTTGAPIVWNQAEPTFNTQKGLAGGNFYWVGAGDDTKGHNVYGVGTALLDDNLSVAPGKPSAAVCGTNSCHFTLAQPPSFYTFGNGGCEGCHTKVSHHDDNNGWYRFLKGHGAKTDSDYVVGDEDDDWEYETSSDHNWYSGTTATYNGGSLTSNQTMSSYCSGCHGAFHGPVLNEEGMGSSTAWIRHPTDIALPQGDSSEYSGYDLTDSGTYVNYSAEAPVAWTNPTNAGNRGTPIVMCLSCHRPHGSQYPDMLRWDYNNMIVGTTGGSVGTGCFTCHTEKDGS